MDTPADPATPFAEVYQSFLDDLVLNGTKPSTIHRRRYAWLGRTRQVAVQRINADGSPTALGIVNGMSEGMAGLAANWA